MASGIHPDGRYREHRLVVPDPASRRGPSPHRRGRPGQFCHLERSHHPTRIVEVEVPAGVGVEFQQQGLRLGMLQCLDPGPHRGVGRCELERIDHGAEVETGAAGDEDRSLRCREETARRLLELGDGVGDGWIDHVDHVVRHPQPLRRRRLGGPDVHAPVHLHRVDREDLGARMFGDLEGHGTLAGAGRPEDRSEPQPTNLPTR